MSAGQPPTTRRPAKAKRSNRRARSARPRAEASSGRRARGPAATSLRSRGRPVLDDKRRRMLDAALTAFAERGYHGVAVPEVAAAAGVSTGTIYVYFESKEAL